MRDHNILEKASVLFLKNSFAGRDVISKYVPKSQIHNDNNEQIIQNILNYISQWNLIRFYISQKTTEKLEKKNCHSLKKRSVNIQLSKVKMMTYIQIDKHVSNI